MHVGWLVNALFSWLSLRLESHRRRIDLNVFVFFLYTIQLLLHLFITSFAHFYFESTLLKIYILFRFFQFIYIFIYFF